MALTRLPSRSLPLANSSVGKVRVDAGSGANTIGLSNVKIGDSTNLDAGDGVDKFNLTNVTADGSISINAGDGKNIVTTNNLSAEAVGILTGNGNDCVTLNHTNVADGSLGINVGDGTDKVTVNDLIATEFGVEVGPGNSDIFRATNATVAKVASFADSGGTNGTIVGSHNLFNGSLVVAGYDHRKGI
jgi:hypothetical protein